MSDQSKLGIGKIIAAKQERDAIHVAVAPVTAAHNLRPGEHVGFTGKMVGRDAKHIGIVDPFLAVNVKAGQSFWLFLYPGSITSLRHDWSHPSFIGCVKEERPQSDSEKWMRAWAMRHMGEDYYGDGEHKSEDAAFQCAIQSGHDLYVGPYESTRDHIDDEWWNHWEIITGEKGKRGEYFSCSC